MLFSTDWFVPYWSILGIEAKTEQRTFQNGCREIVLQLIGAAEDYYQIDFSAARGANQGRIQLSQQRRYNPKWADAWRSW